MAISNDPFTSYLAKAETLFQAGDVVQAGQIWQAILKKVPNHSDARAGLYKVKLYFDARATQDGLSPDQAMAAALPAEPAAPTPVSTADEVERLLRDGCTLFDMGESQDALKKWEQILVLEPGHQLAEAYIKDARRELGLESPVREAEATDATTAMAVASQPSPITQAAIPERIEKLLREGTQLYDMGMVEEACRMWEQVLQLDPDHGDGQAYLSMAKREHSATPAVPPPPVPEPPTSHPPKVELEPRLRHAESLLHQGHLEEAAYCFQEILALAPQNFRALQGHHQANGLLEARQHTHAAAQQEMYPATPPVPWAEEEIAPEAPVLIKADYGSEPEVLPVHPPATLTAPASPTRRGLEIPQLLRQLEGEIPAWLKNPKIIGAIVGGVLVANLAFLWFRAHRKDVLLRNAVVEFRTSAQVPMARNLEILDFSENPEAIRKEAQSLLERQPLLAYYRGQELVRLNPLDAPAAHLMGRAGQLMAQTPGYGKGSVKEVDKLLSGGDLDAAKKMLLNLLQANPDDPDLKARAGRLSLALTEIYALKERWGDAEDQLKEARLMFPADKSWGARLQLLEHIKNLRGEERRSWITILG